MSVCDHNRSGFFKCNYWDFVPFPFVVRLYTLRERENKSICLVLIIYLLESNFFVCLNTVNEKQQFWENFPIYISLSERNFS